MMKPSLFRLPRLLVAICLAAICIPACPARADSAPVYKDPKAPLEKRVDDLLGRMTMQEKLSLVTGGGFWTNAIPRLDIPEMQMADAGQGVRGGCTKNTTGPASLFPCPLVQSSTWDTDLVGRIGEAIGAEALNKGPGIQVMLAPDINIVRTPLGGRDGEFFSEDPFLNARLAVSYVERLQATGCAACSKAYVVYNQEASRSSVNVLVGERALREIYLPAFEATAREAHAWTFMSSYNQVNGYHVSANKYLLNDVLKGDWNWDGMVMSDWGGVHEVGGVMMAGNDLEMPGPGYLRADRVEQALHDGLVTQAQVDENVRRIVRTIIRTGCVDPVRHVPDPSVVNSPEHQKLTFEAAASGIVLLKNQGGLLPLDVSKIHSIAVFGRAASQMQYGAEGSPGLTPFYRISPLDGLRKRVQDPAMVTYVEASLPTEVIPVNAFTTPDGAPGLRGEYFANKTLSGSPVATRTDQVIDFHWATSPILGVPRSGYSVRWTGKLTAPASGSYTFLAPPEDGCRMYLDNELLINDFADGEHQSSSRPVPLVAGKTYDLRVEYIQRLRSPVARLEWVKPDEKVLGAVRAAAAAADVAIVVAGTLGTEGEGRDRLTMDLPGGQAQVIAAAAAANKRTIVVLNNGSPVTFSPWLQNVPALVEAWFPGQEGGHALAAILFGDVNPSGKLPITLGARREDYPDYGNYPGTAGTVKYAEGIYVGYRHFDKKGIEPAFPFGYGLSYTTFKYSNLRLSSKVFDPRRGLNVFVDLSNTGKRAGKGVVELYVHDPAPKVDKPVRELKGFAKVALEPGQTKTVAITLNGRCFAYCDVPGKRWRADAGVYNIEIASSSRDIRLSSSVKLKSMFTEPIPHCAQAPAPPVRGVDIAQGHKAASSADLNADYPAAAAFDGDLETRWSSPFSDPQWISVDLDKPTNIAGVGLIWEFAYGKQYRIQVSLDGATWTDVYRTDMGSSGTEVIHFKPVFARYVRMYGERRGTPYGYSLYSFEVYAK